MQLLKPLSKETQELSRLDLSSCGLKCDYIFSLRNEVALVGGILELNLGGNHMGEEVCFFLAVLFLGLELCGLLVAVNHSL